MFSEYYLIRSKTDGSYLVARPQADTTGYLLLFRENFEASTYLNTHACDVASRFAVEFQTGSGVSNLLKRWGFQGVGIVKDPLLPNIEFLTHI